MSIRQKIANVLELVYGIGVLVALFVGGISFLIYLVAFIIGGNMATEICTFTYKTLYPILFYFSSSVVLIGLIKMYVAGEKSMVPTKRQTKPYKDKKDC